MLICTNLTKRFGEKTAVDNLSFTLSHGEIFGLLGNNGAGKTTTIKMILGLIKKDEGEIVLDPGVAIGYSPETPYLPPHLTGAETLRYYARIQGIEKQRLPDEIKRVLNATGLENNKTKVKHYSKGMLQRLAVAQALLGEPEFLILDEPTSGLDALGRVEMINLIKDFKAAGKTILFNSHILNDVERVCDRAIIIGNGKALNEWSSQGESQNPLEQIFIETYTSNTLRTGEL